MRNLQEKELKSCPFCGGISGYTFMRVEKIKYSGRWEIYPHQYECIKWINAISRTIPICIDCGKLVKYEVEYPE